MLISLKWINEFTEIDLSNPLKLGQDFTLRCAEVENVIIQKKLYENIVTARIKKIEKHPKADKLWICTVVDNISKYMFLLLFSILLIKSHQNKL